MSPYPRMFSGEESAVIKERWQWTYPIIFSPVDTRILYAGSQHLWKTTNGGAELGPHQPRSHASRSEDDGPVGRSDHARHERPRSVRGHLRGRVRPSARRMSSGPAPTTASCSVTTRRRKDVEQRDAEGHARLRPRQPHRRVGVRLGDARTSRSSVSSSTTRRRTSSARTISGRRGRRS